MIFENLSDMIINSRYCDIIQHRHHFLRQPDIFIFVTHFDTIAAFTGGRNKGQVFCSRRANADAMLFPPVINLYSIKILTCKAMQIKANKKISVLILSDIAQLLTTCVRVVEQPSAAEGDRETVLCLLARKQTPVPPLPLAVS